MKAAGKNGKGNIFCLMGGGEWKIITKQTLYKKITIKPKQIIKEDMCFSNRAFFVLSEDKKKNEKQIKNIYTYIFLKRKNINFKNEL